MQVINFSLQRGAACFGCGHWQSTTHKPLSNEICQVPGPTSRFLRIRWGKHNPLGVELWSPLAVQGLWITGLVPPPLQDLLLSAARAGLAGNTIRNRQSSTARLAGIHSACWVHALRRQL